MSDDYEKTKRVIEIGSELAGAFAGGALGFLAGDALTAASAAVTGVLVAKSAGKVLSDMANRHLSHREEVRVGAAAAFALSAIRDSLKEGKKLRDDNFFTNKDGKRSSADEIFEGVLLKSKNEHQEKKIRLLGNFFANLAFSPEISASEANHLLKIGESLTYRQMCLLGLFYAKPKITNLHLRKNDYLSSDDTVSHEKISLYQEILDMFTQGLLVRSIIDGGHIQSLSGWDEIAPDMMRLTPIGEQLAQLLNIDYKDNEDIDSIVLDLA